MVRVKRILVVLTGQIRGDGLRSTAAGEIDVQCLGGLVVARGGDGIVFPPAPDEDDFNKSFVEVATGFRVLNCADSAKLSLQTPESFVSPRMASGQFL